MNPRNAAVQYVKNNVFPKTSSSSALNNTATLIRHIEADSTLYLPSQQPETRPIMGYIANATVYPMILSSFQEAPFSVKQEK